MTSVGCQFHSLNGIVEVLVAFCHPLQQSRLLKVRHDIYGNYLPFRIADHRMEVPPIGCLHGSRYRMPRPRQQISRLLVPSCASSAAQHQGRKPQAISANLPPISLRQSTRMPAGSGTILSGLLADTKNRSEVWRHHPTG